MRLQADRGRTVLKGPLLLKAVGVTAFFALQLLPIIFSGTASSAVAPTITPGSVLQRIFDTTGRCKGNETTVAMGSTINTQTVCLEANITDGDGDTVRLEVEVKPVGITFDGTTKIFCSPSSDCITTGIQNTTYVATVTGLSYGSSYHWRARGVDFTGAASAWTSFGTNIDRNPLPSDPDFTAVNTPPTIGAMNQRIFDATARCKGNEFTVSEQGTINTRSICVDSTVEDVAGDTVRLEVEVKPAGATFNGTTNIFCSPSNDCVTTGVQTPFPAMVTGLSYGSSYHWRARGVDMVGLATGWTEFGTAGNTDFKTVNTPPTLGAMTQRIFDTSLRCKGNETTVDMGSTINTQAICLDADVQDAAGNGVRLEVEVKPVGVTFNGTTNLFCDDLSTCAGTSGQGQKIVTVTGLSSGTAYHWRARGVDDTGRTDGVSAWTSFGTNTDPFDPDFSIGSPSPTISAMLQRIFDTSLRCKGNETTVAVGGSIGTQTICLEADVTDAAGQSVRLEVEVKEVGTSFDGATNLFCDDLSTCAGTSAQGQKIVTVTGLANGKSYHWRARVVDFPGGTTTSWFSFGNNSDGNPPTVSAASDFTVGNTRPAISAMLQRIFDTSLRCKGNETTVVVGGSINTRVICLDADVTDPDGNAVRLEVEVKPLVKPFDTVTDIFCDDISTCTGTSTGGQKIVTIRGLSYGTEYHWQARGVDSFGADSGWSDFGNNDGAVYPSNVDFIPVNVPPTIIAGSLNQRIFDNSLRCKGNESTVVVGGSINAQTICLEATVNDTDSTQQTRLELEVQPIGTTFGNAATTTGSFDLQTGKYLPVTVSYGTKYHWQARAVDEQGAPSGWILFGANPEPSGIDFSAVNLPPTMITMLQRIFDNSLRCKGNETTVSEQGSVGTTTICLDVNVTDIDPVQTIRLEVEVKPTGSTFDGTTNIFCDDASTCAGTSAQGQKIVTISGRSYGSSYHWQARGVDNLNAATGWTEFGTAGNTDFKVVNLPPTASAVEQRVYDGACDGLGAGEVTVVEGRAIDQTSICLNATLSDPNNKLPLSGLTSNQTITLQVEVQPTTSTFSGTQNWTSTAVTESAPVARVTVGPLQSGTSYHWQYRAVDDTTRADGISAWTEFGTANNTDFTVTNHPPIIDTTTSPPLQRNLFNGTCAVGSGIVIPEGTDVLTTTICLQGNITDPDLNPVRLEVEVEPTTSTFSGTATHSEPPLGSFASGGTKIISVGGLVSGTSYHWKYRGVDDRGAATVWTEFGAANNTDFRMNNFPPTINASTVQQRVDVFADSVCLGSETTVPVGGEINETSICLEANVADVEGNSVRLEVEVQPVLTTFSNTAQFCSPDCSGFTTQGVVITVAVSGRTYGTNYHWQYRGVDNNNVVSAWTSFGGNPEANSDFKVTNTPPTLAFVEQREDLGSCPTTAGNVVAEITGTIGELSICFNATLSDVHVAETIQLQVEVQPTATTFGCPATGTCTARLSGDGDLHGVGEGGDERHREHRADRAGAGGVVVVRDELSLAVPCVG
ncbi:MAG: hypothetical protein HY204_01530 [Nitrospirae bacterium]|nr:hypothetical protein [Nitrospirota bacterium]